MITYMASMKIEGGFKFLNTVGSPIDKGISFLFGSYVQACD